jgi:hypothetical protein
MSVAETWSDWHRELADEPAMIVAAEWIGLLSELSPAGSARVALVPGGHAHAQRPGASATACGRTCADLESFRLDFVNAHDVWRCPACVKRLALDQ